MFKSKLQCFVNYFLLVLFYNLQLSQDRPLKLKAEARSPQIKQLLPAILEVVGGCMAVTLAGFSYCFYIQV